MSLSTLSNRASVRRSEQGFSLLSTLLAVMILAVILAIAVPRFQTAISTANAVKVQADLTALDTAKGQNPKSIDDLADYVTDLKNLKPPSGNVRVGDQDISMEGKTYQIENKKNVYRATCGGKTAEEFRSQQPAK